MAEVRHAKEILDALEALYGNEARPASDFCYAEPLDDLIVTVLSQNTNDKLRDIAYKNLRERYPSWEDVASAELEELKEVIRIAGMSSAKPLRIQQILAAVRGKFGRYSLKSLRGWSQPQVREYLTSLPGVGPKTSAIVECFDLDMPGFPVDTHITRLSKRFGWAGEKEPPDKIQARLEVSLPPERFRGGHLNFLAHGRSLCGARKFLCAGCALIEWCDFGKKTAGHGAR
ncbi:MAG: endonuclease III [Synergistes jonesii]|uniref:endonuclease III domain-containing protein n=1 Tax=Synergistes jonesii TaxID=2754 RepID=UPI002A749CC7|nr:endonuclease III [Synergistes jonesii]MDY2984730.1 endonuclease III [Synergistes jonesii]